MRKAAVNSTLAELGPDQLSLLVVLLLGLWFCWAVTIVSGLQTNLVKQAGAQRQAQIFSKFGPRIKIYFLL